MDSFASSLTKRNKWKGKGKGRSLKDLLVLSLSLFFTLTCPLTPLFTTPFTPSHSITMAKEQTKEEEEEEEQENQQQQAASNNNNQQAPAAEPEEKEAAAAGKAKGTATKAEEEEAEGLPVSTSTHTSRSTLFPSPSNPLFLIPSYTHIKHTHHITLTTKTAQPLHPRRDRALAHPSGTQDKQCPCQARYRRSRAWPRDGSHGLRRRLLEDRRR